MSPTLLCERRDTTGLRFAPAEESVVSRAILNVCDLMYVRMQSFTVMTEPPLFTIWEDESEEPSADWL